MVERVEVKFGETQAWMTRHHAPQTALDARLPLSEEALHRKFADCAAAGGRADHESLYALLQGIEDLADLRLLAQASPTG